MMGDNSAGRWSFANPNINASLSQNSEDECIATFNEKKMKKKLKSS